MERENENTHITDADLSFMEGELAKTNSPVKLEELVKKMAFKKTARQLSFTATKYDPDCVYQVGDLVYKEYDESLTVSSKGSEPFKGSVVLKVVNKIALPDFNCEMLEVDFTGGGMFRKHIDYMKKTNTQVLLPSNCDGKAKTPARLKKEDDPRLRELPMTDKDLKKLERNLKGALSKSEKFFNWDDFWQLENKRIRAKDKEIKSIAEHFKKTQLSTATPDLVTQFFNVKPEEESFALHCLSLNYLLDKEHKKNFVYISPENWGKWFDRETLDSFLANLPITKPKAKVPDFDEETVESIAPPPEMPLKVYLTWREVLSGCIKIPKSMNRHFTQSREYIFTDTDKGKDYVIFYYPSSHIFYGLKEFYEKNNVPQGASLTIEKKSLIECDFSLKKSKKKLEVPVLTYDPAKDKMEDSGSETFTFSLPNKIIFLERETLATLFSLYNQRKSADLRDLLILAFKNFGLEGDTLSLHYQRAFHLIDVLRHTTLEDVEKVLLNSMEFSQSEKSKGLFIYQTEEEAPGEIPLDEMAERTREREKPAMAKEREEEILPEIGTVGEIVVPEGPEIIEVIEPEEKVKVTEVERPRAAPPARPARRKKEIREDLKEEKAPPTAPKKEKAPKKKKDRLKTEQEKAPRRRWGDKRFIEERIELEESGMEALFAIKAKDEEPEAAELAAPAKKEVELEEIEASAEEKYVSEKPTSSIFADKLKSALDKQQPKLVDTEKKGKKKRKRK